MSKTTAQNPEEEWDSESLAETLGLDESAPRILTTKQVSDLLGVSSQTVINWIENGEMPAMQLPGGTGQRRKFRVPLRGLLRTLKTNHAMADEDLRDVVTAAKEVAGR